MADAPAPAQPVNPNVFLVKAIDQRSKTEVTIQVTKNSNIQSQQDAEEHVKNMAKSIGGTHPGFEVSPTVVVPANTDPATASA